MDVSMQMVEERSVYYREEEPPVLELEEPPNDWEGESNYGDEAAGEARGQCGGSGFYIIMVIWYNSHAVN